jgi:hypothetical protein
LWFSRVSTAVLKNFISVDVNCYVFFFLKVLISLPYKRMWKASALYIFILGIYEPKLV